MLILPFDKVHLAESLAECLNEREEGANELTLDDELGHRRLLIEIFMDHLRDLGHNLRCQHHLLHELLGGRADHVALLAYQLEKDAHMPLEKLSQLLFRRPRHQKPLFLCLLVNDSLMSLLLLFLVAIVVLLSHLHYFLGVHGGL